ncbi:hypothetical protein ACFWJY_09370 [Streptomyces anulatus]|uniref:hypothetical protein n=1 Tax=Streptomyces anulatus TaxID=1892 RepID=UPI003657E6FE
MTKDIGARQKAYRRRAADQAPVPDPDPAPNPAPDPEPGPELPAALMPFVDGTTLGISQALCKALYRVHTAHLRGHEPAEHIAKLASVNPDRIKIPDIDEGRRLRASLRALPLPRTRTYSRNGRSTGSGRPPRSAPREPAPTTVTATPPHSTAPVSFSEPHGPGPCGPVRTWARSYFSHAAAHLALGPYGHG